MTSFARLVRILFRDRRCDNNHRHRIDSWWRSCGFYVFTKSYDSMEISGEDDQTNSAGARPTRRDLLQRREWWTRTHLHDDQTQEQDWWNETHVPSHQLGEQERSEQGPAPADSSDAMSICSTSSSDADAAHEYSLSLWSTFGRQCACPSVGLVE